MKILNNVLLGIFDDFGRVGNLDDLWRGLEWFIWRWWRRFEMVDEEVEGFLKEGLRMDEGMWLWWGGLGEGMGWVLEDWEWFFGIVVVYILFDVLILLVWRENLQSIYEFVKIKKLIFLFVIFIVFFCHIKVSKNGYFKNISINFCIKIVRQNKLTKILLSNTLNKISVASSFIYFSSSKISIKIINNLIFQITNNCYELCNLNI